MKMASGDEAVSKAVWGDPLCDPRRASQPAHDPQGAVTAFDVELLDVGAEGFGDP
jgi:hypothetical protein